MRNMPRRTKMAAVRRIGGIRGWGEENVAGGATFSSPHPRIPPMRLTAAIFVLLGMFLIAVGRHFVRRSRRLRTGGGQNSQLRTWRPRLAGWTLTVLGFLAILFGFIIWGP